MTPTVRLSLNYRTFTLSAPSLAQSAVKADVPQVYYDHYNNSYRVRHYVPKTNPYHHPYHHPYHY